MSDFPKDFPGTEHYRERAAFLRKHEPMVYHRPYRIDLEALCDHIESLEKQNEQWRERAALEARRVLKNGSKALKLQRQVGEQDKEIERLREENDWMRRWMGEFGYTEAFEGWRKFKTPACDDEEERP